MTINELIEKFDLCLIGGKTPNEETISAGYSGDLLSEVMVNAPSGSVWLTVQGHPTVIAIAVQKQMTGVIITGGYQADPETIAHANDKNIPLMLTDHSSFDLIARFCRQKVDFT